MIERCVQSYSRPVSSLSLCILEHVLQADIILVKDSSFFVATPTSLIGKADLIVILVTGWLLMIINFFPAIQV